MANNGFQSELENMIDDIVKEDKKRIALAFERIKKETEKKIREAIKIAMIDNYYNGYDPIKYVRTSQLNKLTIRVTNKRGEERLYTYTVKEYNPKLEEEIFGNFMQGIHPNAIPIGVTATPTTNVYEEINKALDFLLEDGIIDRIIQDAFSK